MNTKKYITLDQALEVLDRQSCYWAAEYMKLIPVADVQEVVTCGECAYADSFSPTCTESTFPLKCLSIRYGGVYPDWFCEHGKRAQKTNC